MAANNKNDKIVDLLSKLLKQVEELNREKRTSNSINNTVPFATKASTNGNSFFGRKSDEDVDKELNLGDGFNLKNNKSKGSAKGSAKGAIAGAIGGMINQYVRQTLDIFVQGFKAYYQIQKTNINAEKEIMTKRLNLYSDALIKASNNFATILTGSLSDTIYNSLNNAFDFGLSHINRNIEMRQIDYERRMQNRITRLNQINSTVGTGLGIAGQNFQSAGAPWAVVVGTILTTGQEILRATSELEAMKLQTEMEINSKVNDLQKEYNEKVFNYAKGQAKFGENIDKLLIKLDNSAYELSRNLGIGAQATVDYKNAIIDINMQMSMLGKSWEDMIKIQQAYTEASDRNIKLTGKNAAQTSAIGMLFGIGDAESGAIMGAMNIFNKSIEDGSNMMFTMYKTASKMGLSNQKFAKDLQQTLKLSQRYQFKDGVKGVMDMALWAQKVRMNINEMESALSKMHTGNIEDVIQTSARLNVLGGNAALFSNPMNILYNAYADPKKYMENINNMIKGFGTIDRKSGETTFSIAEQMKIEQIANTMGVSAESLFNQARQGNKSEAIKRRFGNKFGKSFDYVANNALWDEARGTWVVNVLNNGKVEERTLDKLTKEEIEKIFPEDNQEQLLTYVGRMLSIMEDEHKVQGIINSLVMGEVSGTHDDTHRRINKNTLETTKQNLDYFTQITTATFSTIETSMNNELELQKKMRDSWKETGKTVLEIVTEMTDQSFKTSLEEFKDVLDAFSSSEGWENLLKKYRPDLYGEWLEANGGNRIEDIKNDFGGQGPWTKGTMIGNYLLNPLGMIPDWIKGTLGANWDLSNAGRMIGAYMDENTLSAYKKAHGISGDREAADKAYREGIIDAYTDEIGITHVVWGKNARKNDGNGVPGTPIYDSYGRPLEFMRGPGGMQRASGDKQQGIESFFNMSTNPINAFQQLVAQDAIITPRGMVYTHPDDTIMAFKPGGPIMNGMNGTNGTSRVEVSGSLKLETNGQSVNLMEIIKNDPMAWTRLTEGIINQGFQNKYGRSPHAPQRYTFG